MKLIAFVSLDEIDYLSSLITLSLYSSVYFSLERLLFLMRSFLYDELDRRGVISFWDDLTGKASYVLILTTRV